MIRKNYLSNLCYNFLKTFFLLIFLQGFAYSGSLLEQYGFQKVEQINSFANSDSIPLKIYRVEELGYIIDDSSIYLNKNLDGNNAIIAELVPLDSEDGIVFRKASLINLTRNGTSFFYIIDIKTYANDKIIVSLIAEDGSSMDFDPSINAIKLNLPTDNTFAGLISDIWSGLSNIWNDLRPFMLCTLQTVLGINVDNISVSNFESIMLSLNQLLTSYCTLGAEKQEIIGILGTCGGCPGVPSGKWNCPACKLLIAKYLSCKASSIISNCVNGGNACTKSPGDWDYCSDPNCGPCGVGEGDCDRDSECQSGLICVHDVGAKYGWAPRVDVCEQPTCTRSPGDWDYCSDPNCGPCGVGEGDCDRDSECQSGLICVHDVGAKYGWASWVDVCE